MSELCCRKTCQSMLGTIHVIHGFQPLLLVLISIVIFLCRCYFSYHFLSTCGSDSKESACNAGDPGLIPELGRSPGEGNGNPVQYPLPGESHGQRSLAGYNPWGCKESDMTGRLTLSLDCFSIHTVNCPEFSVLSKNNPPFAFVLIQILSILLAPRSIIFCS